MKLLILGGGLGGLTLAYYLQNLPQVSSIEIIEKEAEIGGLCRSFEHNGVVFDIGPHILFSQNKPALEFLLGLLGENAETYRRSNFILHKGHRVQYPFENDLSHLPPHDCAFCLEKFLDNPYRDYPANNMLQFFLQTFGEGITNLYLRPYNEKIWKFDPVFMNTQMVERIPRPPDAEIIRSAKGETIDGYLHQLHFQYPKLGGMGAMISALQAKLGDKVKIHLGEEVSHIEQNNGFVVNAKFHGDKLVSTMPLDILASIYTSTPTEIQARAKELLHNDIAIALVTVKNDNADGCQTLTIADRDTIFHRVTRLNYWNYHQPGYVTYLVEVTYRPELCQDLQEQIESGMVKSGLITEQEKIIDFHLRTFPYAYVIYDLHHTNNANAVREYFNREGIVLHGRFGMFEYWNMDRIVAESYRLAEKMKGYLV
jgi:protoporphyrinogen oxidase